MNHDPFKWGRPSDDAYGNYNYNIANAKQRDDMVNLAQFPKMNTQQPIVTGTSVISIKFNEGVMLAADHMGAYGSLLRFTDIERIIQVGEAWVGISGDISDMQKIERLLDDLEISEGYDCSGHELKAPHIHEYLSRVFYNRRSKMDPLWNSVIVGGFDEQDKPFLAYVDLLGVTYSAPTLASGFGAHLAIPLLRKAIQNDGDEEKLTEEQAREVMVNCMKVLFYRDARSMDKYTLVTIKKSGAKVESDLKVENMQWGFAKDIKGYGSAQV